MKKESIMRLGLATLAITMISTSLLSGTLAKYTGTVTGSDTATVAKFAYDVTDGTTAIEGKTDINIFNYPTTGLVVDGKIAPGAGGTFNIVTTNTSEVLVDDTLVFTEENTGIIPVYYTFDGNNYSDVVVDGTTAIAGDLAAMSTAISVKNTSLAMTNGTATYTIGWNWATTSDAADTAIGTATTAPTIKLTVGVTIDQLAAVPASN